MTTVKMHRHVCAFIDVLGGAQLFKGKDKSRAKGFFGCLEEFERRLNGWSLHFPKKRQSTALVKTFSDNIFVAFPLKSNSKLSDAEVVALFLLELVGQVRHLTVMAGFPMRGAVTIGSLMFSDKFLFGPALVEAVELEKAAVFPRIVLSRSVTQCIQKNDLYHSIALRDVDGQVFLHYLRDAQLFPSLFANHRDFVRAGLESNLSRIRERQKYEWLAKYHNHHAHTMGRLDLRVETNLDPYFSPFEKM